MSNSTQKPDVITIRVSHEEHIQPAYANLHVRVEGTSVVSGRMALKKAREVAELVAALKDLGITEEDIDLTNVTARVSSGIFSKSSAVDYGLQIRCRDLDAIPEVMTAITEQKNAELNTVNWHYPEDVQQQVRWLQACLEKADRKARAAAEVLGVRIIGVHNLTEGLKDEPHVQHQPRFVGPPAAKGRFAGSGGTIDLGMSISSSRQIEYRVTVEYRVSEMPSP